MLRTTTLWQKEILNILKIMFNNVIFVIKN